MTTKFLAGAGVAEGGTARRPADWLASAWSRLATWLEIRADHWAAAEMYRQLWALSEGELARRGLSRATLAHEVRAAFVRDPKQTG